MFLSVLSPYKESNPSTVNLNPPGPRFGRILLAAFSVFLASCLQMPVQAGMSDFLWSDPAGGMAEITGMSSHDGTTVAVGAGGVIFVTTDGIHWQQQPVPVASYFYDAAYGNGVWVVVGNLGATLTSPDATTWTNVKSKSEAFLAVCFDGQYFIATTYSGKIYRSIDGTSWVEETMPANSITLWGIATNGTQTVATGNSGVIFLRDQDGIWTRVDDGVTGNDLFCITWSGTQFVAAGESETVVSSADGAIWTDITSPHRLGGYTIYDIVSGDSGLVATTSYAGRLWFMDESENLTVIDPAQYPILSASQNITWDGSHYITVDQSGNFARSSDLVNWSIQPWITPGINILSLAAHDGSVITVGNRGSIIRQGTDSEWIIQTTGNNDQINYITYLNNTWMAFSDKFYTSTDDGLSWSASTPLGSEITIKKMVWQPGLGYAAITFSDQIWISADGSAWSEHSLPSGTGYTRDILAVDNQIIVVMEEAILWSETAETGTWNAASFDSEYTSLRGIIWDGSNGYLAYGADGVLFQSSDGNSWTSIASPTTDYIVTGTYGHGRFILGVDHGIIWSSSDLSNWTWEESRWNTYYTQMSTWDGEVYATSLSGTIQQSPSSGEWQHLSQSKYSGAFNGIHYSNGRYVAVGDDGGIQTSPDGRNLYRMYSPNTSKNLKEVAANDAGTVWAAVGSGCIHSWEGPGTIWQQTLSIESTLTPGYSLELYGITYGHDRFVAVGNEGTTFWSDDGLTWNTETTGTNISFKDVYSWDNGFVAVGAAGNVYFSEDGKTWTQSARPGYGLYTVAWNGSMFLAGGSSVLYSSSDGVSWSTLPTGPWGGSYPDRINFEVIDGWFYAAHRSAVYRSTDGQSWEKANVPGYVWAVAGTGDDLVAVGDNGGMFTAIAEAVPPPVISTEPENDTIIAGQGTSLSVSASGDGTLVYQWYKGNSGDYSIPVGSDSTSLNTGTLSVTTSYWVKVSNEGGSVNSSTATVTVLQPPVITDEPESTSIVSGNTATLHVTVTGSLPITYQWYAGQSGDQSNPVGANASSYTSPALAADAAYWVKISNDAGTMDSQTASITVLYPPQFTSEPGDDTILAGESATLTVVVTGTEPIDYQWYEGASGDDSNPVSGADSTTYTTPALQTTAQYWIQATNIATSTNSTTAIITVLHPPAITDVSGDIIITHGQSATLNVTATGTKPLTYQWYEGHSGDESQPVAGADADTYDSGAIDQTSSYWVKVSNVAGNASSNTVTVTVNYPPSIITEPDNETVLSGDSVTLSVDATGTEPLDYQWYEGESGDLSNPVTNSDSDTFTSSPLTRTTKYWVRISNAAGHADSDTATVTIQTIPAITSQPGSAMIARGQSVTLSVTATGTEPLSYQWYSGTSGNTSQPVADAGDDTFTAFSLQADASFWVRISNDAGMIDSNTAAILVLDPPAITNDPDDTTIVLGESNTLQVTATGSEPLHYTWFTGESGDENNPVTGSNAAGITVTPVNDTTYWVKVENEVGAVSSAAATVTVLYPPTISLSSDQNAVSEGSTVDLTAAATGTGPLTYEWYLGTSGNDNTRIADASGNTLTTFPIVVDTSIWVRVRNSVGYADSATLTITVNKDLVILAQTHSSVVEYGETAELYVLAEGAQPISYAWYEGESGDLTSPVTGVNDANLHLADIQDLAAYWVRVENGSGQVDSETIRIRPYQAHQTWGWNSPQPAGSPLLDVAWFKNRYYVVGEFGAIMSSSDGTDWIPEFSGTDVTLHALATSDDRIVAVGEDNTVLVSRDGVLWIPVNAGLSGDFLGIYWDGSKFLATTDNHSVMISDDGTQWETYGVPGLTGEYELRALAGNGSNYVLIGGRPVNYTKDGLVYTSSDGESWTRNEMIDFDEVRDILWTGSRYLVCGDYGTIYTSPDGQIWTEQTTSMQGHMYSLTEGDSELLAIGASGIIWRSTDDGITWIEQVTNEEQDLVGCVWANQQFVAVCSKDPYNDNDLRGSILTSPDGASWTQRQTGFTDDLTGICKGPQGFVAVGVGGVIYSSPDGNSWSHVTTTSSTNWRGVIYTGTDYVAYGRFGKIARSPDGFNWTVETPGPGVDYNGACMAEGTLYLAGLRSVVREDGEGGWETIDPGAPRTIYDIEYGSDRLVIVGLTGLLMTSENGTDWTEITPVVGNSLNSIVWGDEGFVAVGTQSSDYTSSIIYSSDGLTWFPGNDGSFENRTITFKNSVVWDGSRYVTACAAGYIATSLTGLSWHVHRTPTDRFLWDLVADGKDLYVVGENGTIVSSRLMFITRQPDDQVIEANQQALLQVSGIAGSNAQYQWYEGNAGDTSIPVAGADAATWVTGPMSESTSFWVRITNNNEFVDSRAAAITVEEAFVLPAFVQSPVDVTITEGESAYFTGIITGNPLPTTIWQEAQWNGSDWIWTNYFGTDNRNTLVLENHTAIHSGTTLRLLATASIGGQTVYLSSKEAVLYVNSLAGPDPFVQWLADNSLDDSDPDTSALLDSDGDGLALLMEFLLGGDPAVVDGNLIGIGKDPLYGDLLVSFHIESDYGELILYLESSEMLAQWQAHELWFSDSTWQIESPLQIESATGSGDGQWSLVIRVPENHGEEKLFIRLKISR